MNDYGSADHGVLAEQTEHGVDGGGAEGVELFEASIFAAEITDLVFVGTTSIWTRGRIDPKRIVMPACPQAWIVLIVSSFEIDWILMNVIASGLFLKAFELDLGLHREKWGDLGQSDLSSQAFMAELRVPHFGPDLSDFGAGQKFVRAIWFINHHKK